MIATVASKPRRIAGYIRVSTEMQVEEGESLADQEQRIRAEAERRGWSVETFRDLGLSAKNADRPGYQGMLNALKARRVVGIITTRFDRLWRDLALAVSDLKLITDLGAELVVLDQQIDTTTPTGRALLHMILAFAQLERETTAERVTVAMRSRARQGRFNGGPVPYGYRLEGDRLVVDEAEAAVVRRMFELFLVKPSIRQVRLELDRTGSRTRRGVRWAGETIRRLLASKLYIGVLTYNQRTVKSGKAKPVPADQHIVVPSAVPAIIDQELFEQVQAKLALKPLAPRSQASPHLLSGLIRCGNCGGGMYAHYAQRELRPTKLRARPARSAEVDADWLGDLEAGRNAVLQNNKLVEVLRYFSCPTRGRKDADACPGNSVRADVLEHAVLGTLFDLRLNPERLRALETQQQKRRRSDVPKLRQEVGRLERKVGEMAGREERILSAFESGAYDAAKMHERLAKVADEKRGVEERLAGSRESLAAAERQVVDVDAVLTALTNAHELFEKLTFDGRRSMLRSLIDRIVVESKAGGTIHLRADVSQLAGGLFELEGGGVKTFRLGDPNRAWAPGKQLAEVDAGVVSDQQRTGIRLDSIITPMPRGIVIEFSRYRSGTFAERIKKVRSERRLTQKQLARRAGLSQDLIYRWERGMHGARAGSLDRVCAVLGVSPSYLRYGTGG